MILTDADAVYQEWGTPRQRHSARHHAGTGADGGGGRRHGAEIMAVSRFVDRTGRTAHIGGLQDIDAVLAGQAGTSILP